MGEEDENDDENDDDLNAAEIGDDNDREDDIGIFDDPRSTNIGTVARIAPAGGGLGSNIFNRRERLDVKKPGPFYQNSANNFFLDKVKNILCIP